MACVKQDGVLCRICHLLISKYPPTPYDFFIIFKQVPLLFPRSKLLLALQRLMYFLDPAKVCLFQVWSCLLQCLSLVPSSFGLQKLDKLHSYGTANHRGCPRLLIASHCRTLFNDAGSLFKVQKVLQSVLPFGCHAFFSSRHPLGDDCSFNSFQYLDPQTGQPCGALHHKVLPCNSQQCIPLESRSVGLSGPRQCF